MLDHNRTPGRIPDSHTASNRPRWILYALICAILVSTLYLCFAWRRHQAIVSSEAVMLAKSLASLLHPEHVAVLAGDDTDLVKPEYVMLRKSLAQLVNTNNPIRFAYLLGILGDDIVFLIDSEPADSPDYSPPGQVYTEAEDICLDPFLNGETVLTPPGTDRWGRWISALVPVMDSSGGRVIAVFGIDYAASGWQARLWGRMAPDIAITVCLVLLLSAFLHTWHQRSDLRRLSQKLAFNEALYHSIYEQAPIGIAIMDDKSSFFHPDYARITVNPMFEQIIGRTAGEFAGMDWTNITHPDDLAEDLEQFARFQKGEIGGYTLEKRFLRPDGSDVWTSMKIAPFLVGPDDRILHICLLEDITERNKLEDQLNYRNEHDELTDLHNRSYLERLLLREMGKGGAVSGAIVCINLSTMHALTQLYGYDYSRQLMMRVADALRQLCDERRQLFCVGEFHLAFLVQDAGAAADHLAFCERVSDTLEQVLAIERIGGGIGVVELDGMGSGQMVQLFKNIMTASERALDSHKREIGICFFDSQMEQQILREEKISRALSRIAADEDGDRLYLQFQPIVDLATDRICSFEALARLSSKSLGIVSPMEFIPIAEKTKLIIPLGFIIVRQALQFLTRLKDAGHTDISVSINISAVQLLREGFTGQLLEMIKSFAIRPETIELEFTESMFSADFQDINSIISELKEHGIKSAIDDFGTGYSSFARERDLNVDFLKIDKSFIDRLLSLRPEEAITGDIISMAHKMGHCAVAEG
ncbi:MAG: EAL domain-containing protein, partial [Bacillota bacterium]|nr:EAL domain-containing protein [Bacillota bacterium]